VNLYTTFKHASATWYEGQGFGGGTGEATLVVPRSLAGQCTEKIGIRDKDGGNLEKFAWTVGKESNKHFLKGGAVPAMTSAL